MISNTIGSAPNGKKEFPYTTLSRGPLRSLRARLRRGSPPKAELSPAHPHRGSSISSRPVGYAAEYLTRGAFPAIPMGSFPLMFIYCILYHFWGVRRILLPPLPNQSPPRQIRREPSNQLSSSHSQLKPSIVQTFSSPSFLNQFFQPMFLDPTALYFLHSPAITPHFAALHSLSSAQSSNARASLYQPTTQSPLFHQPRHTIKTHSSPPPTPTGNSFTLYRPSTNSCNINSHHVNTYFLVAATTVFLTFSQVKLLSNISGIGSSSASSKYINPRKGKESSETENFSLYKESI